MNEKPTIVLAQPPSKSLEIYIYHDSRDPEDVLKIGMTSVGVKERVEQAVSGVLRPAGVEDYEVIFHGAAIRPDGTTFDDHAVHRRLEGKGVRRLESADGRKTEFFRCRKEEAVSAYWDVFYQRESQEARDLSFPMRREQEEAVQAAGRHFQETDDDPDGAPARFLWNCKMRFGKTFAAYQLAKRMGYKKVLIFTFKPAAENAWEKDLLRHRDFEGWQYISRKKGESLGKKIDKQFKEADKSRPIVIFGSFQDLLGADKTAGKFKKQHEFLHEEHWDLVIFDEYHFGAWREGAKAFFGNLDEENPDAEAEVAEKSLDNYPLSEKDLRINSKHYLYLSGTPFRMLGNGEFTEKEMFTWTYSDEQRAKASWKGGRRENPYRSLPEIMLYAIRLPEWVEEAGVKEGKDSFALDEFFKAEESGGTYRFLHENEVSKFLTLLHAGSPEKELGERDEAPWPFSQGKNSPKAMNHTVWFLKGVAACHAMKQLLQSPEHRPFYNQFHIIDASGPEAGNGIDALAPVEEAMANPLLTKTITLTCGKLTTGVTVRPWSGILMLRDLKSPETYFQSAFRIQSPWTGKDEEGNEIIYKEQCYIFDFSPTRALSQIAEYGANAGDVSYLEGKTQEKNIEELISYLPVLVYDGSCFQNVNASSILDFLSTGTTADMLAKKWNDIRLINLSEDVLTNILSTPDALGAIEKIEGFRQLGRPREVIAAVIGTSKRIKELDSKEGGDPKLLSKEIEKEKKEYADKKKKIREKLQKFIERIPIFMYLTDKREQPLVDVIRSQDPVLFTKVTGLSIQDFELLLKLKLFHAPLMNDAVRSFRRHEQESLSYLGVNRHEGEKVAGFYSDEETDSPMTSEKADPVSEEGLRDKDEELAPRNDVLSGNNVDEKKAEEEPLTEIPADHVQLHEKSSGGHEQGNAIPAKQPFLHGAEGLLRGAVLEHASYGKVLIRWTLAFLVAFETEDGRSVLVSKRRFLQQGWRPLP